jgi:phage recombination protein Bet
MGLPEARDPDMLPAKIGEVLSREQIDLITRTVAKGASRDELALFLHACKRTGLDPLMRQIHAVKRWNAHAQREEMTIQTGIDGLRLVAERTGCYAPGREPAFVYDLEGKLVSAAAYVKKQTVDGTWHEVAATAHYAEYVQKKKDGAVTAFWQRMPHVMLSKCAEALALRRAFPMELSGVYAHEEMAQASAESEEIPGDKAPAALPDQSGEPARHPAAPDDNTLTAKQEKLVHARRQSRGISDESMKVYLARELGVERVSEIPFTQVNAVLKWIDLQERQPGEE